MNARAASNDGTELTQFSCGVCPAYQVNMCQAAAAAAWSAGRPAPLQLQQSTYSVPPRKIICREQDLYDAVPVICSGWAASIVMLPDGRRQILSFLLPGDLVSSALLFEPVKSCMVEAITVVSYRTYRRAELKALLFAKPDLMDRLASTWVAEKARCDQLIVDLGRRTAEERIARLVFNLMDRLTQRGMMKPGDTTVEFPLRQHHIADAVGLTSVHVSKVITDFRRRGLMAIDDRELRLLNVDDLRRVAFSRH